MVISERTFGIIDSNQYDLPVGRYNVIESCPLKWPCRPNQIFPLGLPDLSHRHQCKSAPARPQAALNQAGVFASLPHVWSSVTWVLFDGRCRTFWYNWVYYCICKCKFILIWNKMARFLKETFSYITRFIMLLPWSQIAVPTINIHRDLNHGLEKMAHILQTTF